MGLLILCLKVPYIEIKTCHFRSIFREDEKECKLTIKVYRPNISQQLFSVNGAHSWTQTNVAWTKIFMHVVQGVRHGVHSVNDKLDLSFLLIGRVSCNSFQACENEKM